MSTNDNPGQPPVVPSKDHNAGFSEQPSEPNHFCACSNEIRPLIEKRKPSHEVLEKIVRCAKELPSISTAAIFLSPDSRSRSQELELVSQAGSQEIPEPVTSRTKSGSIRTSISKEEEQGSPFHYVKIKALNKTVGWLAVHVKESLSEYIGDCLKELAFFAGVAYEKPKISAKIKHFGNKLEVLGELNKLVASGAVVDKIMRTVSREAAFRFSADCAVGLLLSDSKDSLEVRGSYGCPPKTLPQSIEVHDTQLGRAMKLGGVMSVPDLTARDDHGLSFLEEYGFTCVHWSSLDIRGESQGVLVVGFKQGRELNEFDGDMLEEFAQGAAVAILNARNREKLAKYAGKLEELVEERTADLAVQTARADEANQAKSRFVANMSHELRTPLTAIVGYSSVVAEGVFGEINKEQKDALEAIAKAGEHLKELINDVLDVSKVEAGKEDAEPKEVPMYELLEQIHKLMMQTAMGKGVKLNPVGKPEDEKDREIKLWVDRRHIRQILINMLSNAVKYTPSDGEVSLSLEKVGDKAKITVSDTGVGMTEEERVKVFERFSRGDDSYSRTQVGTGIGLSLTKRLIEMNGGKIGVESEQGKGSDFWILVPLADENMIVEEAIAADSADALSSGRLDGLNVLVVDDNHSTCEVLKTIIQSVGGNPYIAYSVKEAKKIAHKTSLDTALIDLAIPGENGIELLDYFKNQCEKPLSSMPLIVVSACVFESDKNEALKRGASAFIDKPFAPSIIVSTIRDLTSSAMLKAY